ncbi:proton-conducting membrane transporter [Ancylomarina euxinus]|uniref:Proton-conducting membrane transporter n=1 Tax=Ancylomarina euxinus TaxID=2283627 RepID=A0A425Y1L6_9BACT|nr:NAD(P)H-dependent oxidoreductase subunit E [Ancylomarina euxinus]MCZ4693844.1 NAD(P)H-dependent oxidoreductase subunit E [Ancylomarina euxinus]MUP15077.1 proton-conducting membrane transporter [Ancylomarina euxinus]RRG21633.1 proton-conducting membrane transporter [Ancylomarina euxinus]
MNNNINDIVDRIVAVKGISSEKVISILQAIQAELNYLPEEALKRVCEITEITQAQISGISTFYSQFRHQPVGEHIVRVCVGTACHVKGAGQVYDAFRRELKLADGEETDSDKKFTLEEVACLGCCTLAPVVQIDDVTYGHVETGTVKDVLEDFLLKEGRESEEKVRTLSEKGLPQGEIRIGLGSCCIASGSSGVKEALEDTLSNSGINVDVKQVGCVGVCNQVPMMEIHKPGEDAVYYTKLKSEDVGDIIQRHFKSDGFMNRFKSRFYNYAENLTFSNIPLSSDHYSVNEADTPIAEFLKGQINIATEYRGEIRPSDFEEYKSKEGFSALEKCLKDLSPNQIIDEIEKSGLKGRGGAGFPSAIKWRMVNKVQSDKKYIICNGDEGDPGAFMDRMLLESYPFRIIEGIIIAAYAVGATEGRLYIRAEYPLAVERIREGIKICREKGILGQNILGSGFSFDMEIFEGAGAFVCGEETALIASIEGKRGIPQLRPPYPAEKGLWNQPTLINNTETFSLVPWILRNGSDKFCEIGTEKSKGTKVFALAGKINRGGLIEVPMGISIRQIVEEIGGGVAGGKKFKAVQIGGPSGGCIPASMADTCIDFDSLKEVGAMMGSGGLIVLDESDCMVDIAHYFLSFTQEESCGRCTFCRIGTRRMLEILNKIKTGKGKLEDLDLLEKLAINTKKGSICGLGQTAPNPVLSTLKYFRHEYEAHINGTCPSGKCESLIKYEIKDECTGCTKCAQRCPVDAIKAKPYELHEVDNELCIKCDICRQICPVDAVVIR